MRFAKIAAQGLLRIILPSLVCTLASTARANPFDIPDKPQVPSDGTPGATPTPVPEDVGNASSATRLGKNELSWSIGLLEGSFKSEASEKNRARLLEAYEKALHIVCMPQLLKTLSYAGNPHGDCLYFIRKTREIFATDPVADCAEFGIDSGQCRIAYKKPLLGTIDSSSMIEEPTNSGNADVDELLEKAKLKDNRAENEALDKELSALVRNTKLPAAELDQKRAEIFRKLIGINCRVWHLKLEAPYTARDTLVRTYTIPATCEYYANKIITVVPDFPEANCAKFGYTSPQCVIALRKAKNVGAKGKAAPDSQKSFDSF